MRRARAENRERGVVVVESVLVIGIILVLFFGVLEFGLLLRSRHALSEASRTGARAASSLPRTDGYHLAAAEAVAASLQDSIPSNAVLDLIIYKADPVTGYPDSGASNFNGCGNCYRFEWNQLSREFDVLAGPTWAYSNQSACGDVANTDYVGVYVTGEYDFVTTFWSDKVTLSDRTVMRLEPIIDSSVCS